MARIILKLNNGGDYIKGYYTDKLYRKFNNLISRNIYIFFVFIHYCLKLLLVFFFCVWLIDYEVLTVNSKRIEHVNTLLQVLRDLLGDKILPNFKECLTIYGRVSINKIMREKT